MIDEERIALIASGCNVSQKEAEQIYLRQLEEEKANPYSGLAERAKARKIENKMKKHKLSGKDMAGGK